MEKAQGEGQSESVGPILPETIGEVTLGMRIGVWKRTVTRDEGYHGSEG